jgi:hypothetical protein
VNPSSPQGPFAALRRFVQARPAVERCELCACVLPPEHPHLLELTSRQVACSCDACALLFPGGVQGARFRRIPRDARPLPDFRLGDGLWERLRVPIGLAFFYLDSRTGKPAAVYPSPAGPMQALLPLEAWPELVADNPALAEMEPDVLALLVNRVFTPHECFLAPIDECFRLVGLIRGHWRGLSGGSEVWDEVSRFFARLRGGDHA